MEGLRIIQPDHVAGPSNLPMGASEAHSECGRAHRILIIDRDSESIQALQIRLAQAGFVVATLHPGDDARVTMDRDSPDLIMLDWDLPGVYTMELVRHARRPTASRAMRLVALSTFAGEHHVVAGLEMGLDDYVIKPFSVREVVARVRALLRPLSATHEDRDYLEFHRLRLEPNEGRVTVRDRTVSLRATEFRLLEFLLRHPERAFRREHLLERVWGRACAADARAVDVTIQRIRKALEPHDCHGYLQTIRGVGYRISANTSGS